MVLIWPDMGLQHILNVTKLQHLSCNAIQLLALGQHGTNSQNLQVVIPIMTYCASIWTRGSQIKRNAKKIRRVQAPALRFMTEAMPSTPFVSLNRLSYTHDIIITLWGEAAKGAATLRAKGFWSLEYFATTKGTIKAHITINNDFMDDLNIPDTERNLSKHTLNSARTFQVILLYYIETIYGMFSHRHSAPRHDNMLHRHRIKPRRWLYHKNKFLLRMDNFIRINIFMNFMYQILSTAHNL